MTDFTTDDLDSLGAKLDAALGDDVEVEGYAIDRPDSHNRFANHEVSYFVPRLRTILGTYIGETEKNL